VLLTAPRPLAGVWMTDSGGTAPSTGAILVVLPAALSFARGSRTARRWSGQAHKGAMSIVCVGGAQAGHQGPYPRRAVRWATARSSVKGWLLNIRRYCWMNAVASSPNTAVASSKLGMVGLGCPRTRSSITSAGTGSQL
jgi:hypothetical protein